MIPVRTIARHESLGLVETWFVDHNNIMLETEDEMFVLNVVSGDVSRVCDFRTSIKQVMALIVEGKRHYRHLSVTEAEANGQGYSVDCALEVIPNFISTVVRLIIERADPSGIEKTMVEQRLGRVAVEQRKSSGGYSFYYLGDPQSDSEPTSSRQELEDLLIRLSKNYDELISMNWPDSD